MSTIEVKVSLPEGELLDACDDLQRLLDDERDACPALRDALFALDDAITAAFVEAEMCRQRPRHHRDAAADGGKAAQVVRKAKRTLSARR